MPKDLLPDAIAWEADRMRTAHITEKDRVDEMPIVRNEFERGENLPLEALDKQIWAIAYQAHPYHHSTIGWRSDIEKVSIERLKQFYDDFYWPDNATVTVIGNFKEKETLALIAKEFGIYPKKPGAYPAVYTEEPKQEGERRAQVSRAGNDIVGIAHKIPHALHADMPALLVLATILDNGKASRFYKALVDTALATEVATYCYELHDPGLFFTYATLTPGTKHEKAEKIIVDTYRTIATKGVSVPELARARRLLRTSLAQRKDGPYQYLAVLNESIATGDWTHFVSIPEAVGKVTAADVKRVAQTYFIDSQSTKGHFMNSAA
jgi:zinc protease